MPALPWPEGWHGGYDAGCLPNAVLALTGVVLVPVSAHDARRGVTHSDTVVHWADAHPEARDEPADERALARVARGDLL